MNDIDKKFIAKTNILIKKYKLKKRNDFCILISSANIGEVYFCISTIMHNQKKFNKNIYVITTMNSSAEIFIDAHNNNGAQINKIIIDNDYFDLYKKTSKDILARYESLMGYFLLDGLPFNSSLKDGQFFRYGASIDTLNNLTRPKYFISDVRNYESYGIVPGKTLLVIPHAVYRNYFNPLFIKLVMHTFKIFGFKILINSPDKDIFGNEYTYIYPPLTDLVWLADTCGYVLSVQTGLIEMIAAESSAKICILSYHYNCIDYYKFINFSDNHIVFHDVSKFLTTGFGEIDDYVNSVLRPYSYENINIKENECISTPLINPDLYFEKRRNHHELFSYPGCSPNKGFCKISYHLLKYANKLGIKIYITPPYHFSVNYALVDINSGTIIMQYHNVSINPVFFQISNSSSYKILCKVFTGDNYSDACFFETLPIYINPNSSISSCNNFYDYIKMLKGNDELIAFIVSKDTPVGKGSKILDVLSILGSNLCQLDLYRHAYLCIIDNKKIIYEKESKAHKIASSYLLKNSYITFESSGFYYKHSASDPISIKVNNHEYALNHRGLNLCVLDKSSNKVIDSVCFDTFLDPPNCLRFNDLYSKNNIT